MNIKFVFSFTSSGLFSQVNNFLLALLYAHKNGFEIIIDYQYLATTDEKTLKEILDLRKYENCTSKIICNASNRNLETFTFGYSGIAKYLRVVKYYFNIFLFRVYSLVTNSKIDLFQKHWEKIRQLRLNLSESDKEYLFSISKRIWVHSNTNSSQPSSKYIGVHVRRGDKITETDFISIDKYCVEILKHCEMNKISIVYLFIDSKADGVRLKSKLNNLNVIVDTGLHENGYDQQNHSNLSNETKAIQALLLCDLVNLMINSSYFIGSFDSNLSSFISIMRENKNVTDLRNGGLLIY